jgi:hypothetical protein
VSELARALEVARHQATTPSASNTEIATPSSNDVVEH